MLARPIVAAPLVGLFLGDPLVGLKIGALLELLWLGKLPVGAAVPPDDTQVAIGATVLVIALAPMLGGAEGSGLLLLVLLVAMPLGKVGQYFDRLARHGNARLLLRAEEALEREDLVTVERCHRRGLLHFAAAAVATYLLIVLAGKGLLPLLYPLYGGLLGDVSGWVQLIFFLVGSAAIVGTLNVSRAMTLFAASFASALLLFWLR